MRNSRSVEHAALNKPPVARFGTSALARSISCCRWRIRALASAAETANVDVDAELLALLTLLLLLSRMMLSRVMLSRVIEADPTIGGREAAGIRSRVRTNESAGL